MNPEDVMSAMLANPDKARCELSLMDFAKQAWPVLEPGVEFKTNWATEALAEHLQAVTEGHVKRLLVNVPPGQSKSVLTNVYWPAFEWGPRGLALHRFISASYEQGLATRDLVRGRDLIKSEWFQRWWPIEFKADQDQKTYYENTKTGWRLAASVRAALTGYRGDRIIVDDPHSVRGAESDLEREEALRWFAEVLPTRLNDLSKSAIVVIMQRLHQRDVSGLILEELGPEWVHLCLPMEFESDRRCKTTVVMPSGKTFEDERTQEGELLHPERFPRDAVEQLKQQLRSWGGSFSEAGQLQQRPVPREGGMFKVAKFRIIDAPIPGLATVRAWDLAATSRKKNPRAAWTAGVKMTWCEGGILVIEDARRIQGGPGEVKDFLVSTAHQDGTEVRISIPQDPGQAGVAQVSDLALALQGYLVFGSPETGDKASRAGPLAAQVNAENVCLVRGPWNDAYLAEAALFPASTYKDQIDASSRGHSELLAMRPQTSVRIAPTLFQA